MLVTQGILKKSLVKQGIIKGVASEPEPVLENLSVITEMLNIDMGWPGDIAITNTKLPAGTYKLMATVNQTGGDSRGLSIKWGSIKASPVRTTDTEWYWEFTSTSSSYNVSLRTDTGGFQGDLTNIVLNEVI